MAKRAGGNGGKEASTAKQRSTRSRTGKTSASAARKSRSAKTSRARESSDDATREDDALSDADARKALAESDKLYYRIGEVSRLTGVKAHVLRYWETEFRWMAPPKSRSKQRLYRKRDIEFVWLLKRLLWDERYTIAGARQRIQDLGVDEALALLSPGVAAVTAAKGPDAASVPGAADAARGRSARVDGQADGSAAGSIRTGTDWVTFRAALDEMQNDLLALRGVLQDGD